MKKQLVSILIPLYNAEKYIAETLENCLAQTYENIEIIIVDDGSTDHSLMIAKEYAQKYDNIKVYTQKNAGAPRARNLAFEKSSGEYIQYLDADDLMSENKIASQMTLVEAYDKETVFSSKFSYFTESMDDARLMFQKCDRSFDSGLEWLLTSWSGGGFGVVMSWLTPRHLIEKAGPWDEALRKNQDGEFFCRVLLNVQRVILTEDTMVYYRETGDTSISSQFKETAAASTLHSLRLYEENCTGISHPGLKKALAYNFLEFIENYYPHFPVLLDEAEKEIHQLGFNYHTLETPGKLGPLSRILGSKNIIKLRYLLQKKRGR
jgi:glycosyltransferase involved in cell wall biosynthesis